MSNKNKRKKFIPKNPELDSSVYIEPQRIADTARVFSDVAIELAQNRLDTHDVKLNVIYTNATLAIELYFKAFLVERVSAPYDLKGGKGEAKADELCVTFLHSRLELPEEYESHSLDFLYTKLCQKLKNQLVHEVIENTSIKSADELESFIFKIKGYFVSKRYEYERFILGVPADSDVIYTLIPLLKCIRKVFANPPDVPFKEFSWSGKS
ncbi:hypothetical protein [Yersinia ruckeri]|uniref:hypothetical protein n=1 Tax=Yersinia ruckeri TaxID=29486 RepID=UPI002237B07E|nr:hypothetical protein [Yersinia ruckeri]MCW6615617.1 hypothetical protein [Yersinia ruckeri]